MNEASKKGEVAFLSIFFLLGSYPIFCQKVTNFHICVVLAFLMGTKMKGIYKGFKFISQIFVVKEQELEIGCPTDVKHVAHIGSDGPSGATPAWMKEFQTRPDLSSSTRDYGEQISPTSDNVKDVSSTEIRATPKKHKRKKNKSSSSPRSGSTSRLNRPSRSKTKFVEDNAKASSIEVA